MSFLTYDITSSLEFFEDIFFLKVLPFFVSLYSDIQFHGVNLLTYVISLAMLILGIDVVIAIVKPRRSERRSDK